MNPSLLRAPIALCTLALLVLLSACGNAPDNDVIRDALNLELKEAHLDALLEADDVEIADRQQQDDDHYTLAVSYTLRAKRDLSDYSKEIKNDEDRDAMDRFAMIMALAAVRVQFGDFAKDDHFTQERRLNLEHGEEGWVIPRPQRPAQDGNKKQDAGNSQTDTGI
ncbi:hypothetical protein CEK62_10710 [Alcanivorax sp. N3-2A]|nr:hypothetical protein CEK62_10710 [Alcanivorax sp. N3-2A]|tara:strand:+ start:13434 stop:13931 length:498 start_codon:yes stop_codon:yes gene_type:complete